VVTNRSYRRAERGARSRCANIRSVTNELKRGRGHTRIKIYVALAVGIVVAVLLSFFDAIHHALIAGWAAACLVYIVWVWTAVWRMDATTTRDHATLEDPGRRTADLVLIFAALASVVAVVWVLVDARHLKGGAQLGVALLAVLSVALSWLLVHTLYTLRYARIYYRGDGGVDFNQEEPAAVQRLRLSGAHARDDVPGVGHQHLELVPAPHDPGAHAALLRVRHGDRGLDGEPGGRAHLTYRTKR
jgi:uncharacterized membrane protein